jgi:site-specific recombinase XerD
MSVLGPIVDGFDDWLAANGYTRSSRRDAMRMLRRVDGDFQHRQVKEIANLTHAILYACWRSLIRTDGGRAGTVRTLERYLTETGLLSGCGSTTGASPASTLIEEYASYLQEVRGLNSATVSNLRRTVACFLRHMDEEGATLKDIQPRHLESYIVKASRRLGRGTLRGKISALRGFLRFLALDGRVPEGLDNQIEAPRVYRGEQLPRALPWETVRALLRSIDRTSAVGLRDYAMFVLLATYGLRASEVVAITLDDISWRQRSLRIQQRKTSSFLDLPLTNEVACALVKHLRKTPPPPPHRRIFLRMHAPVGALKPSAVADIFCSLVRKSRLTIPFHGPHCLRHSFAVHLLRNGTPLKTIGDILGHRFVESTWTYLRLATEDLREVPLSVPATEQPAKEGQR